MLSNEIIKYIEKSILCWLATADADGMPNVSPKEIFNYHGNNLIIANIASPQSVANIKLNNKVCVSFIDILVQKGWQLKGTATLLEKEDPNFDELEKILLKMTNGKFPFSTIICIHIEQAKPIVAPSYLLYSETTEQQQIENAVKAYQLSLFK